MAFEAVTVLQIVVLITWKCISQPIHMNGLFKQVFFDKTVLAEVASAASLSFCPGLLEAIQAFGPPTIDFFLSTPTDCHGRWAVYVIVMKKQGFIPYIYIGSGTEVRRGVRSRWHMYDMVSRSNLPQEVLAAIDDGYKIVHKGMLVWCKIPSAANVPRVRLLFVAMEAGLSFTFWAMKSITKDYKIGDCCPWSRKLFTYRGLCTHNSLIEIVNGKFDLSAAQLETLAAEAKERKRLWDREYHRNQRLTDVERVRALQREADARFYKTAKGKAKVERFSKNTKASRKYYCEVCQVACDRPNHLERHKTTPRHLKKVAEATAGVVKKYQCKVCGPACSYDYLSELEKHNRGQRHLERAAANRTTSNE